MFVESFADWVLKHRFLTMTLIVLLSFGCGIGFKNFETTSSPRIFYGENDSGLAALDELTDTYSSEEYAVIIVEPLEGDVFTPRILSLVQTITTLGWQVPYSSRVDSLTNYMVSKIDGDNMEVVHLVEDPNALTMEQLAEKRQYAINKPGIKNNLVSDDGSLAVININFAYGNVAIDKGQVESIDFINSHISEWEQEYPDVKFRLVGTSVIGVEMPKIVLNDAKLLIPVSTTLLILVLILVLRDFWSTWAAITTCILAVIAGLGVVLWSGIKVSPPLSNTPGIILLLGMADCIHIIVNYAQGLDKGLTKQNAMRESIIVNFQPVVLTSVTTALSFFALNFSECPPYGHLGNAVGAGVLFAMLASLTFFPALVTLLPAKAQGVAKFPNIGRLVFVLRDNINIYLATFVIVTVSLIALIPNNELDDSFLDFFEDELIPKQNINFVAERLSGPTVIYVSVAAKGDGGVADPEYLRVLEQYAEYEKNQHKVRNVLSIVDMMKTLNQNMHGDDPDWYRIPESRELASQYLLLYEMSLPWGFDLNNQMNQTRSASRLVLNLDALTINESVAKDAEIHAWFNENAPSYMTPTVGSGVLVFAKMQQKNIRNLVVGFVVALACVSLLLIGFFKSPKLGAISIFPNLLPAAIAFGIWSIVSGKIGMGISVGFTMTLGIVVDDTIHFLSKFKRAREQMGMITIDAVQYAMESVGVAMIITTAMITGGFSAMVLSMFTPNQDVGLITMITVVVALFVDLILLPMILIKVYGENSRFEEVEEEGALVT